MCLFLVMKKRYFERHVEGFARGENALLDIPLLWQPPLAYQQISSVYEDVASACSSVSPTVVLFPLELTLKDYLNRVFETIELALQNSSLYIVPVKLASPLVADTTPVGVHGSPASLPGRRTSFVKAMLVDESPVAERGDVPSLLRCVLSQCRSQAEVKTSQDAERRQLHECTSRVLRCFELAMRPGLVSGHLVPLDVLFADAETLVLQLLAAAPPLQQRAVGALRQLRKQYQAHARFKEKRVERLGLHWADVDEQLGRALVSVLLPGCPNPRSAPESSANELLERCQDLRAALEGAVEMEHLSLLQVPLEQFTDLPIPPA